MNVPRIRPAGALRLVLLLAFAFVLVGCDDDNPASLAPFEPEFVNVADSFSAQATGVKNVTTTVTRTWSNSGTRATVDHSTTVDAGSAQLRIKDDAGVTVYDKALVPSLNEATDAGQAGDWTIEIILVNYSGTLNFTAEKL